MTSQGNGEFQMEMARPVFWDLHPSKQECVDAEKKHLKKYCHTWYRKGTVTEVEDLLTEGQVPRVAKVER